MHGPRLIHYNCRIMVNGIPEKLLIDLRMIPRDRPVALLLRHAARFPILDPALTFEIGLTEEGVRTAEELGSLLPGWFQPGRFLAAPVSRCLDTAAAIARGAGWAVDVLPDERISHPFMAPAFEILSQEPSGGMVPVQVRVALDLLLHAPELAASERNPRLDILVSHDTVLGTLVSSLMHEPITQKNWPGYLEGIFVWEAGGQVHARWRGKETIAAESQARFE